MVAEDASGNADTGGNAGGLPGYGGLAAALIAVAAVAGLTADGIYHDNALVTASWRGTDVVSLVVAVPLLVVASLTTRRGSAPGTLLCLGLLAYAAYNYAFYLFGAAFNRLFLVYVAVLVVSTLGLIFGLSSRRVRSMADRIVVARRDRWIGWLVVLVALGLGLFWVWASVDDLRTGRVPPMVTATGHPTNVTGALDLWLVVTFGLLGGGWLARGKPWGFIVSAVWTVKGAVYMIALSAASLSSYVAGATDGMAETGLWGPIGAACVLGAAALLRPGGSLSTRERPSGLEIG